jgi:hypothetical protein
LSQPVGSPWERWAAIPADQRNQVDRLARRGHRHPDPNVAEAAEGWARVIVDSYDVDHSGGGRVSGWVVNGIALLTPIGDLFGGDEWLERRWARKVLRAR